MRHLWLRLIGTTFILLAPLAFSQMSRDPKPPAGTLSALFGEGELKVESIAGPTGPSSVRYIRKGGEVFEHDVIETSPEQTATVLLQDSSELVLAPSTRCLVEAFIKAKGQGGGFEFHTILNLIHGSLSALVSHIYRNHTNSGFSVHTVNAIMGVRGTHFIALYDSKKATTDLHVLSGTVAMGDVALGPSIVSSPAALLVASGMNSLVVGPPGPPSNPVPFNTKSYMQQLKAQSPDFERAVNAQLMGANQGGGAPKSLSDALKAKHDANQNGPDPRNLRGKRPGIGGAGSGMGPVGAQGNGPGGAQANGQTNQQGNGPAGSNTGGLPPPPGGGAPPPPPPGGGAPPPPPPGGRR